MREIYETLRRCYEANERAVLATIVSVVGSVYRQAGARCVIQENGQIVGIVSGGCVEKDLFYYAEQVLETGRPQFTEYDFRSEDDLIWGMGVGCNGALRLWLQPFDPLGHPTETDAILAEWKRRMTGDEPYMVATLVESKGHPEQEGTLLHDAELGAHGVPEVDGLHRMSLGNADSLHAGNQGSDAGDNSATPDEGTESWYVEHVEPRPHLVVFGAGADAAPLIRSAQFVGWRTTLVDHRADWASEKNFPGVDEYRIIRRTEYGLVEIPKGASVILMTHQYELDFQALKNVLESEAQYVGSLGPRKRLNQMLDEWEKRGTVWKDGALERLYSPVGLDIGSETPEEIALAAVAEILAASKGRKGTSLRERAEAPIHALSQASGHGSDRGSSDASGGASGGAGRV